MIIKRNKQKRTNISPPQEEIVVKKEQDSTLQGDKTTETPADVVVPQKNKLDIFEGFDFNSVDFKQRAERRRGDRRRGYRRIDDRNLISRAQQEAIMIKEQASKEGFEKGLVEAHKTVKSLKSALEEFLTYKQEVYEQITQDILDISIKVAEKIIKKEVEKDKSVLDSIVSDALKNIAKDENKIILKVNPADVEYTKEIIPSFLSSGQIEAKIYVTGDMDVHEGSTVIETSNGVIDANIRTQLDIIKEAFKQV